MSSQPSAQEAPGTAHGYATPNDDLHSSFHISPERTRTSVPLLQPSASGLVAQTRLSLSQVNNDPLRAAAEAAFGTSFLRAAPSLSALEEKYQRHLAARQSIARGN